MQRNNCTLFYFNTITLSKHSVIWMRLSCGTKMMLRQLSFIRSHFSCFKRLTRWQKFIDFSLIWILIQSFLHPTPPPTPPPPSPLPTHHRFFIFWQIHQKFSIACREVQYCPNYGSTVATSWELSSAYLSEWNSLKCSGKSADGYL